MTGSVYSVYISLLQSPYPSLTVSGALQFRPGPFSSFICTLSLPSASQGVWCPLPHFSPLFHPVSWIPDLYWAPAQHPHQGFLDFRNSTCPNFNSAPPQLPPCKLLDPHTPQPVLSTIFPISGDVSFILLVVPAKELLLVLPLKYIQTLTSSCHLHCNQRGLSSWYFLWIIARACKAFLSHGTANVLGQIILCYEACPLHLGWLAASLTAIHWTPFAPSP